MSRIFLRVILAQFPNGAPAIRLRDREGNEQLLDGEDARAPHGEALIEIDAPDGVIDFPGWLTDYGAGNALPVDAANPRRRAPEPFTGRNVKPRALPTPAPAAQAPGPRKAAPQRSARRPRG